MYYARQLVPRRAWLLVRRFQIIRIKKVLAKDSQLLQRGLVKILGLSEVTNFDVAGRVHQYVFWFKVAVADESLVDLLQADENVGGDVTDLGLGETHIVSLIITFDYQLLEIAISSQVHQKVQALLILEGLVQLYNLPNALKLPHDVPLLEYLLRAETR